MSQKVPTPGLNPPPTVRSAVHSGTKKTDGNLRIIERSPSRPLLGAWLFAVSKKTRSEPCSKFYCRAARKPVPGFVDRVLGSLQLGSRPSTRLLLRCVFGRITADLCHRRLDLLHFQELQHHYDIIPYHPMSFQNYVIFQNLIFHIFHICSNNVWSFPSCSFKA